MPRTPLRVLLAGVAACGCGMGTYTSWTSTSTTGDTTSHNEGTTDTARCGDGLAAEGEVCFQVERRASFLAPPVLLPGDFDGDGTREYYADEAFLGGHHWILREDPSAMTVMHEGWFGGGEPYDPFTTHGVYRASTADVDLDGKSDLLAFVQYSYWAGDAGDVAFCGIPMRARPGFQFIYDLLLCWEPDFDFPHETPDLFDGTFGDFDGDGKADLFFAPNIHHALNLYTDPGAPEKELFLFRQDLDLKPYALQDNVVTVAVDLDDDGRDDIVLADGLGRVWTFHSDPDGVLEFRAFTDTPVLPPKTGTLLARDVDADGIVDLVAGATRWMEGKQLPGQFAIARGTGDGRFELLAAWTAPSGPTETSSPFTARIFYVHLVLLDLDDSGYPALVYALREEKALVVHPQVARTLGGNPVVIPLDLEPRAIFADPQDDGTVDLLVSLAPDENGTENDPSDDIGPFIDRYRLAP